MRNQIYLIYFSLLILLESCSVNLTKETTVTFISDIQADVTIYDPIDGMHNPDYVTEWMLLKPNIPTIHQVKVDNFAYIEFKISSSGNESKIILLLTEGNAVDIFYSSDGKIRIGGDNAEGITYLNDNYLKFGWGALRSLTTSAFEKSITDSINFEVLDKEIEKLNQLELPYVKDLQSMLDRDVINKRFYDIVSTDLECLLPVSIKSAYFTLRYGQFSKRYMPNNEEEIKIDQREKDIILSNTLFSEYKSPKYYYNPQTSYYQKKYNDLSEEERKSLLPNYRIETFGPYAYWLLAPDSIQLKELGSKTIFYLNKGSRIFNYDELLKYFNDKFPDKEYTTILAEGIKEYDEKKDHKADVIFLDSKAISSFRDLSQVKELKGKYLYIDLWNVGCGHCLVEFKYKEQLYNLIEQYDDLDVLYISIDNDRGENAWRQTIDFYDVDGYHLRTTDVFRDYMSVILFGGKNIYIPRFLLLDKEGNIIKDNLPRPSQIEELKKALDDALLK